MRLRNFTLASLTLAPFLLAATDSIQNVEEKSSLTKNSPLQALLPQEILDRATHYLKEINCEPNGHFVLLKDEYFWSSEVDSLKRMHRNAILNFAEKKEVGKSIKYVFSTLPEGMTAKVKVAACYIYVGDEVLLVERPESNKSEPAKWGIPGGKIEKGETAFDAIHREIMEETSIDFRKDFSAQVVRELEPVYVILPSGFCFLYCPFEIHLPCKPEVRLSNEHVSYRWMTLEEARKRLPLITGEEECFDIKMREDCFKNGSIKS